MTTHFGSPSRVLRRRQGALKRLPQKAKVLAKDKPKTNPRTQEMLDLERERLTKSIAGKKNY